VETALRSPATPAADVARLGWEQQLGYRVLRAHPEWVPAVLAAVPGDVRSVIEANERAGRGLATLAEPQPQLPDWRIEAPPAPQELVGYYREAEAAFGIPWPYLAAIHLVETRMGRIRGASSAGAQGPMQFIPSTWAAYGEGDINNPRDAILAAGRYLDASGGPEDMSRALYAYNHSLRYVDAVQAYAGVIAIAQELAYRGYYHWQVYYATTRGVMLLPEGYPQRQAVPTTR
jgi:membrane-bound lytic murein transglycosylase B